MSTPSKVSSSKSKPKKPKASKSKMSRAQSKAWKLKQEKIAAKKLQRTKYYAADRAAYARRVAGKKALKMIDSAGDQIAALCDDAARTALDCAAAIPFYADIRPCAFNPHKDCKSPATCLLVYGRSGYVPSFQCFDSTHDCDYPCWGLAPRPVLYGLKKLEADADFAATKANWQPSLTRASSQDQDIMTEV